MTANMAEQYFPGQASQFMYNSALVQSMPGVEMTGYSPARAFNSGEAFAPHNQSPMANAWAHASQAALHADSGLKTTLFQTTQGLGQTVYHDNMSTPSMYSNAASSMHHPSLEPSAFQDYSTAMCQPPDVVIPSQVNNHEGISMEYPGYDINDHADEDLAQSFDSSGTGYSSWDPNGLQSPAGQSYVKSEDESNMSPGSRQYYSPSRPHKSRSKRSKRPLQTSHVLAEHDAYGFTIRVTGQEYVRLDEKHCIAKHPASSKAERCNWVKDGKECERKFSRAEHLKRHMTMHLNEWPYPCPLDGCTKKMKRPDNAGDHFKTHLKPPAKGKRNKQCTLEQLATAMENDERWDEKKLSKMLTNLSKWFAEFKETQAEEKRARALEEETIARNERMQQSRYSKL